jgi:hypothetical protein
MAFTIPVATYKALPEEVIYFKRDKHHANFDWEENFDVNNPYTHHQKSCKKSSFNF